ncbi:MAG: adenylyltransferase/cytidyltransferase family protein [Nanobdellota archaeon]
MRALFLGRFQPFHKGHLDALAQIEEEELIIAIGSSQTHDTEDNPFPAGMRRRMINESVKKPFRLAYIEDTETDKEWMNNITLLDFDIIYTGNPDTEKLFREHGYKVKKLDFNEDITATEIRKRIREGKGWHHLVPDAVKDIIASIL